MTLLTASILMLALGPLLYRLARDRQEGLALLDGFIVVAISGLVLLLVLPEAVHEGGWWAVPFAAFGLLGPTLLERTHHDAAHRTHTATLMLASFGLGIHAIFDGAALNLSTPGLEHRHSLLPMAVLLHRLPVGLTVWWLLRPAGRRVAATALALIGVGTGVGFFFGKQVLLYLDGAAMAWFEALVAGSLLHVVLHRYPAPRHARGGATWYDGVGGLVGILFLALMLGREALRDGDSLTVQAWQTFVGLALASAGPLLLAYVMAGLVTVFLPKSSVDWMGRGGAFTQAWRGVAIGLPFPVCSCGVIPLYRSFVRRGVPATAAMAFLVATPELGLDAVLLSIPLLGVRMTIVRVLAAAVVALLVGWLVGRWVGRGEVGEPEDGCADVHAGPFGDRVKTSFRWGFGEVVDHTASWILLGLAVAALTRPLLRPELIELLPRGADVVLFALLGLPTYVCASGATPLVAVLLVSGVSPGAALAFLLTGPATNLTTVGILSRLHGRGAAVAFAAAMMTTSVGLGYLVNALFPFVADDAVLATTAETASPVQWIGLFVIALLYLLALLRLGARRFFVENLLPE